MPHHRLCKILLGVVLLSLATMGSFLNQEPQKPPPVPVQNNVFGQSLTSCSTDPMTGYFRDGYCNTNRRDRGQHVVCAVMTEEFLEFTQSRGNDLSEANPKFQFPGLQAGDHWCLCASRWREAAEADVGPPLFLEATHERVLRYVPEDLLKIHALQ